MIKCRSSLGTYLLNLYSIQLKLKASVARLNAGKECCRIRAGKVLKHTHQSQLLCTELYNMLDWPLKSINLNQYFSPICHSSFSSSLLHYPLLRVNFSFFNHCISFFVSFDCNFLCFPLLSLSLSLLLFFQFLSGLRLALAFISHTRWDPFQLE